jgi:hypothetical protein
MALALSFGAPQASAKCNITLRFTNNNANAIEMLGSESQSRVNGGTWSKMNFQNVTVQPGATGSTSWKTNMSCNGNALRDLRLKYRDQGDSVKYQENFNDHDFDDGDTVTISIEH